MSPYWSYYERSEPRPVKNGLKAKSKRGAIGETWWSKRWVSVLESFNLGSRLTRGRSYARKGQVISITVKAGAVQAMVQGTYPQPYEVTIKLKPLSRDDWEKAVRAMAEKAAFSARLLCGEMPHNIEEAFSGSGVSLLPGKKSELKTDCTCPDWSNPCKHIAAVYYLLAEEFDRDPFLIFKLRGKEREELLEELSAIRCRDSPADAEERAALPQSPEGIKPLQDCLDCFWESGKALESLEIRPRRPEVECAVLEPLGDSPFDIGKRNFSLLLREFYSQAGKSALERAGKEEN